MKDNKTLYIYDEKVPKIVHFLTFGGADFRPKISITSNQ